ncbi:MAG: hypothetical protein M1839_003942 [Geoglossum umbratile]|nr:MAG: hypothetical protein M1839_003942 [Geoglossum umbratile]
MDDVKRTVLVAALSAYADLLAKNTAQLDLEQGKGKGKASDNDVDLTVEIRNQIKLCSELTDSITDATSSKDIARTFEPAGVASNSLEDEHESWERLKGVLKESPANVGPSFSGPQRSYVVDKEPYTNPFTGLPVVPETGYEAGPSDRPPPPLREPPRSHPTVSTQAFPIPVEPTRELPGLPPLSLLLPLEPPSKAPIRPPKPLHLQSLPLPPRPAPTCSATLPPQIPAPPPLPLSPSGPQQPQQGLTASATSPEHGLTRGSNVEQKLATTEQQNDILPSQLYHPLADTSSISPYEQPLISSPHPFDLGTAIQDSSGGVPGDGDHIPNAAHVSTKSLLPEINLLVLAFLQKNTYLRHIAELASKALKAAGSVMNITRTSPAHQPQSLGPQEVVDMPVERSAKLPAEPTVEPADCTPGSGDTYISNASIIGNPQRQVSQEILPPAYDTLSHTSRKSSSASVSSTAESSIWTPSGTSVLSLVSPSTSTNSGDQHYSTSAATPSTAPPVPKLQNRSSWTPTSPTVASPQMSVSSQLPPNIASGVKRSSTWTPTTSLQRRALSQLPPNINPSVKESSSRIPTLPTVASPQESSSPPLPNVTLGVKKSDTWAPTTSSQMSSPSPYQTHPGLTNDPRLSEPSSQQRQDPTQSTQLEFPKGTTPINLNEPLSPPSPSIAPGIKESSSRTPDPPIVTSPQRGTSPLPSSYVTPGVQKSGTWAPTTSLQRSVSSPLSSTITPCTGGSSSKTPTPQIATSPQGCTLFPPSSSVTPSVQKCSTLAPATSPQRSVPSPLSSNIAPGIKESSRGTPSPQIATSPQGSILSSPGVRESNPWAPNTSKRSVSPSLPPDITPSVKEGSTLAPSAASPSKRTSNPFLTSPAATFGTPPDGQVAVRTTFDNRLHRVNTNSKAWERSSVPSLASPSINTNPNQRTSYTRVRQSAASPPLNPPGLHNPRSSPLAADEAFARSLQLEEYRELQMERDLLLAYSIANGTAVDGDVELAYFMSQETATLIASTDAVAASPHFPGPSAHANCDPWDIDRETLQTQCGWLEAREFEMEFSSEDAAIRASLSEAKRLQAEFDKEVQDEEAWDDWKKNNIEECIICGDEQHREELSWPCEHGYCDSCLQEGFKNALVSKTPLKCCKKALSTEDCLGLSAEFVAEYERMMLEFSTRNPMYCCNAQCANFLPPQVIVGDIGTCEKCGSRTCRHCRRQAHPGTFCQEDKETEAVKDLARKKGWKTCPGCNHLIEPISATHPKR